MRVTVVKPFPYSKDGVTVEVVGLGECEIADDAVSGLVSEGYVKVKTVIDESTDMKKPKETLTLKSKT